MPSHAPVSEHDAFDVLDRRAGISSWRHRGNGLEVLVLEDHGVPVATLMVTYRVGSRDEPTGLTGATHFLEHLMFKGTDRFNRDLGNSVFQCLQRVGAQVNATTWLDRTNYYALLPVGALELAAEIEADRMRGARIRPSDVDGERTVILNELDRGESDPVRRLNQAVWSTAFTVHPYRHPTIGWRSDVESITADGLRRFHDAFYWPDNAVVSVIGDVDTRSVLSLLDRTFGQTPAGPAPAPSVRAVEPAQAGPRRTVVRMRGEPGAVVIAWKSPAGLEPETDALVLLAMILGRGKHGRLYRALADQGLTVHHSATVGRFRDPGLFQVFAQPAPGVELQAVENVLRTEIDRVIGEGVTDAELARARRQVRADEAFGRDGPFAAASRLNEAIAAGDWRLYPDAVARMDAVTTEAVRDAASRRLKDRFETTGWFEPET